MTTTKQSNHNGETLEKKKQNVTNTNANITENEDIQSFLCINMYLYNILLFVCWLCSVLTDLY